MPDTLEVDADFAITNSQTLVSETLFLLVQTQYTPGYFGTAGPYGYSLPTLAGSPVPGIAFTSWDSYTLGVTSVSATSVPEPTTLLLLGLGLSGAGLRRLKTRA